MAAGSGGGLVVREKPIARARGANVQYSGDRNVKLPCEMHILLPGALTRRGGAANTSLVQCVYL